MGNRLVKAVEHDWTIFKEAENETARVHQGLEVGPKKKWISDATLELVQQKRKARLQNAKIYNYPIIII